MSTMNTRCPYCQAAIAVSPASGASVACSVCQREFGLPGMAPEEAGNWNRQSGRSTKSILAVLALLVLLAVIGVLTRFSGSGVRNSAVEEIVEVAAPSVVAPMSNGYDQLAGLLLSKDTLTIDYMLVTNQLLSLQGGIRAEVITRDPDRLEVRLLDGELAGQTV